MPKAPENLRQFESLLKVVEELRGPDGCPWDKEQTHATLTRYAIEEAHELAEAIDGGKTEEIRDELGDVLLQVVLHSEIARQDKRFDIHDVIQNLNEKMVRRHPHVFGDVVAKDSQAVLSNWAEIKAKEKGHKKGQPLTFDIPTSLPSLLRSQKIGEKTRKYGFDWKDADDCRPKLDEELQEFFEACASGDREAMQSELGDVLFSIAQLARHLKLDSEQALRQCNSRFESRFQAMQEFAATDKKDWLELNSADKEAYWAKAKKAERG